ncbi:MAG: cation transporter [Betaproteobacteria bacterium]|nr:cation transporter [Betaproteobacteria bacterium]
MANCGCGDVCASDQMRESQGKTLKLVLAINLAMFGVEATAGWLAGSTALLADSLDMLGDALVYGFSLYVLARDDRWKAISAFIKGGIMAGFGLFVLGQAIYKMLHPELPIYETMGAIGFLALAANSVCLYLLWKHRADDVNMRSVWLCSRNDIIANSAVLIAGAGVWLTASQWPDLIVGLGIAALFLRSAVHVFADASRAYRAA